MNGLRIAAAAAAITLTSSIAPAHGPDRAPRYRVEEVTPPASLVTPCVAGIRNFAQGAINDFGVVGGNYNCYSQFDPATGLNTFTGGPFVWSSWFGGLELHDNDPTNCCSFMTSINNRNEIFGADVGPTFTGVKWSLTGGLETVFPNDPTCDVIKLDFAIAGNGRYVVGTGFRADPALPIPGLCLSEAWITRTPSGTIVTSLLSANPTDINALNVGVGVLQGTTAIRLNVVTNELRVLHTGDNLHRAITTDINDLGEVSGYVAALDPDPQPGDCQLLPADAVRWDRDDHETVLQNLPGAVSARAWGVGPKGTTVGDSGPGQYCDPQAATNERAVLWHGDKPLDLNTAIPSHLGVTLASATSVNRWGQITAFGYRDSDPKVICPIFSSDPQTGQQTVDLTPLCRHQRVFVLTPQ
jgi:hypothetical protein